MTRLLTLLAILCLFVPSFAGGYIDLAPPAVKDVLIANPPPEPQKIIERTETIREVERPISPAYGLFAGFNSIYPTIGYAQPDYTLTAGARIDNGQLTGILKMSGRVADLSNKTLILTGGFAIFPQSQGCGYSISIGGEKYLADKLVIYTDLDILSGGLGNSSIGGVELGGRYFF